MEQLVTFGTAKLAKEVGFDVPVQNRYRKDGGLNQDLQRRYGEPINYNDNCFQDEYRQYTSAPTQSELQTWLRDEYHIICESIFVAGLTPKTSQYDSQITASVDDKDYEMKDDIIFRTYEGALEDSIRQALSDIIQYKIIKLTN